MSHSKNLLIIDDETDLADLLQDYLTEASYGVKVANSGRAALAILEQDHQSIDLIVTDNMMPGMSGITLLRQIRKLGYKTPALLMSAVFPQNIQEICAELEISKVLNKPVELESLASSISDLLQK